MVLLIKMCKELLKHLGNKNHFGPLALNCHKLLSIHLA